ncbi:putative quinol monooxygenase [Paenibacillus sp. JX-17]|uniref:Quinol monooxygenase n=1 Tax=Paenibacillus lacisoli TaxID=3064525 RepID=A0ABT9CBR5_9BACL|nr:putative quinol monooxygenase [Paenibacillus sp. JX-17]MDO7906711.1 putative quinol monooxygenase [Paenibacillus sp. JX-17]
MSKFGLFGKFTVEEHQREELVRILLEAAASMQDLEECENYVVHTSAQDPRAVYVHEVWTSENAHQASLQLEAAQTLIRHAKPIIKDVERVCPLIPQGGKGIS